MKRRRKLSFTTRYVLLFGLILLAANIALGFISLNRSKASMRYMIDKNMLDVANTASGMMDGDALAAMTGEDVGSEVYEEMLKRLSVFQNKVDIKFIYAVRQVADARFVFLLDADPLDPAAYGSDIVVSEGLIRAGTGVPAVDDGPLADRWGNFYSAYSPVFDSSGSVACVIGVDYDAAWYDAQVRDHTLSIAMASVLSVLIGGVIIFLITHSVGRKFRQLDEGLSELSDNVDRLMEEVVSLSGGAPRGEAVVDDGADELEALAMRINHMQSDMVVYMDYLHTQAYIDPLTKVRSAAAYHEKIMDINRRISEGNADFCVAVFDINNLKQINDNYGHESGNIIIKGAAEVISRVFGADNTFRIGGDEFAVICMDTREADMVDRMAQVDADVRRFNEQYRNLPVSLYISKGMTSYRPGRDADYRTVFARADGIMYEDKKAFYQTTGNRRRQPQ